MYPTARFQAPRYPAPANPAQAHSHAPPSQQQAYPSYSQAPPSPLSYAPPQAPFAAPFAAPFHAPVVATKRGMPSPIAFGMSLVAVAVALVFDVVFLKVSIPGIGGYAWYLTTALSFGGAGFGAAALTRASKTTAMTAVVFGAVLYGLADLGLGVVLESLSLRGSLILAIQGLVIALITGGAGVRRGLRSIAADD